MPATRAVVTPVLIGLNTLVFVAMVAMGVSILNPTAQDVLSWGANFGPATLSGEWWRLLSAMFLHFGILHLALNMWCLWSLGRLSEGLMNRGTFLLLYLFSGIGGGLLSLAWHPMVISAGASGAVFGVAGGLAALFYVRNVQAPTAAMKKSLASVAIFILYNLVYGVTRPGIDNAAHLGGLAVGLAVGAVLRPGKGNSTLRALGFPAAVACAAALIAGAGLVMRVQRPITELAAGDKLLESGQTDQAIAKLRDVVAAAPDLAAGHYLLGNAYLRAAQNDEAMAEYQKAIELDGANLNYRLNLGVVYLRKDQPDRAVAEFRAVLEKDPENQMAQLDVALAYSELKQYDQALAALGESLKLKPSDPTAYSFMGEAYLGKKDPERAIASFQKALAINSSHVQAGEGLCNAYWAQKNIEKAAACYEGFVVRHPEEQIARRNLSKLYRSSGRVRDADAVLQNANP